MFPSADLRGEDDSGMLGEARGVPEDESGGFDRSLASRRMASCIVKTCSVSFSSALLCATPCALSSFRRLFNPFSRPARRPWLASSSTSTAGGPSLSASLAASAGAVGGKLSASSSKILMKILRSALSGARAIRSRVRFSARRTAAPRIERSVRGNATAGRSWSRRVQRHNVSGGGGGCEDLDRHATKEKQGGIRAGSRRRVHTGNREEGSLDDRKHIEVGEGARVQLLPEGRRAQDDVLSPDLWARKMGWAEDCVNLHEIA